MNGEQIKQVHSTESTKYRDEREQNQAASRQTDSDRFNIQTSSRFKQRVYRTEVDKRADSDRQQIRQNKLISDRQHIHTQTRAVSQMQTLPAQTIFDAEKKQKTRRKPERLQKHKLEGLGNGGLVVDCLDRLRDNQIKVLEKLRLLNGLVVDSSVVVREKEEYVVDIDSYQGCGLPASFGY
ncbi:hypothetical protein Tco_1206674, partial [Tanacetum coccineum]